MGQLYRSWEERRQIVRSMIADTNPPPIRTFNLSPSEDVYFRARSAKIVDELARRSSTFKEYYALPADKPFSPVLLLSMLVFLVSAAIACILYFSTPSGREPYPLISACVSVSVVAIGWAVLGGISHRNTIRQNTNNMLFARFSQAPFGDAMYRFHAAFGHDPKHKVSQETVNDLRAKNDEEGRRAASSVTYLLNYFEFISAGVLRGDLDHRIIRDNIRGVLCYYYDKCEIYIFQSRSNNPRTYEHLIKLRTHYREP